MAVQRRIPELDGLRGIAILLVLLWHYGYRLPEGSKTFFAYVARVDALSWSGVDLFFVLSGFLIGGGLIDNREATNYFSTFYLRRACRILPLYLAMLAIMIGFKAVGIDETDHVIIPLGYYLTFTQNFWMPAHGWGLSLNQTWSLAIEEQFYLTLPLLIWLTPRRWLAPVLLALAVAAPILRSGIVLMSDDPFNAVHVMLPCRMDALVLGVLAALALRTDATQQWIAQNGTALYAAFFAFLACVAFMLVRGYILGSNVMMTGGYSILAALYVVFLLLALRDGPIQKLCCMSWLRQMGIWAYGLYLMHLIIPDFLLRAAGAHPQMLNGYDWSVFAVSVFVVFVAAGLSWSYFEAPLIAWGHRAKGQATAKGPMLGSISPT